MTNKFIILSCLLLPASLAFAINSITPPSETQLQLRRISLLEHALTPSNPEAVATSWAKAAKDRNGAVQYMLLCPDLQKAHLKNLEELNWVTGVSSPWVSSYQVSPQEITEDARTFAVKYQFAAGGKTTYSATDHINVVSIKSTGDSTQKWCISKVNALSPAELLH